MRRFISMLVALIMLTGISAYALDTDLYYEGSYHAYNAEDIYLEINGNRLKTKEMPPIAINGRTLVPVREVFEYLGDEVTWVQNTNQVLIDHGNKTLVLTLGSRDIYMGSSKYSIPSTDPAPMAINSKTMVPIRVTADLLGYEVGWDADTRTVTLDEPGSGSTDDPDEDDSKKDENNADTVSDPKDITRIGLSTNGSTDLVYLACDSPVEPTIYRYDSPERVVLDFNGAQLTAGYSNDSFENGNIIKEVRAANHDSMARLVLDVKSQPNIEIMRSATGIVIIASAASGGYTTKINDLKNGAIYDPDNYSIPVKPDTNTETNDSSVSLDTTGTVDTTSSNSFDYNAVVIDPGHGGSDPGAISGGVKEKDVTLAISLLVRDKLEAAGYNVTMTREGDTYPTLEERVVIASEKNNGKIPAIFVSIHCNSFDTSTANGTQVYYHPDSKYGTILAENIYNANVANTPLKAGQVHDGSTLYVVRKTIQPAALVETAFLSNDSDRAYLVSKEGQEALAQGIYEGIVKTMNVMKGNN